MARPGVTGPAKPPSSKPKPGAKAAGAASPGRRRRGAKKQDPWARAAERMAGVARRVRMGVSAWMVQRWRSPAVAALRRPVEEWHGVGRPDPMLRTALVALGFVLVLVVAVDNGTVRSGFFEAVAAVRHALGLDPEEEDAFAHCLKGATEGAVSTAIPIEAIIVTGELALASPLLVAAGVGLGCGVGTISAMATAGVGWTVHTAAGLWHALSGH